VGLARTNHVKEPTGKTSARGAKITIYPNSWGNIMGTKILYKTPTLQPDVSQLFQLTKELKQHQITLSPDQSYTSAPLPEQRSRKFCTRQKVLYNKNGLRPDQKPNWMGPHDFARNKGPEHAEILILPGYRKILVHRANLQLHWPWTNLP
jgi:hypothetical protein